MAYGEKTPISLAAAQTMAANYDVIAATSTQLKPYIAQMKAINPNLVIVSYVNGLYDTNSSGYPENWYEHDTAGRRIYTFQFGGDLMDPSSSGWVASVVSNCSKQIASNGYDGCFIDNLGEGPFNTGYVTSEPVNAATGAVWTKDAWMSATSAVAHSVVNGMPGAVVLGNGLMNGTHYFDPDGPTSPLSQTTSAAMSELFLRAPTTPVTTFPTETVWKQNVDMLTDAESQDHPVLTTTKVWLPAAHATAAQIEGWHKFALASFLLGSDGGSFFNFSGAQTSAALAAASPEDAVNPGNPLGHYAKVGGVYQRTFSHGLALVNPTGAPVTVPLAGTYTNLNGNTTDGSITLAAGTGDVLTATTSDTGAPLTAMGLPSGGSSGETLSGAVNPTGAGTTWSIDYGSTTDYGTSTTPASLPASFGQQPVTATLTGLAPGTTYHYRLNASNSSGTSPAADATFTTPPLNPTTSNDVVGDLAATTADISGTINTGNGDTTWAVQYGPTARYGSTSPTQQLAGATTPIPATRTVGGLNPVTTYHARLTATNSAGTVYGPDLTFKTMPLTPTATTASASGVTATAATLRGTVNPGGGRTDYAFQYGPTTDYGTLTPTHSAGMGKTASAVTAGISHLLGNTTYHARLIATNASGRTNGADITIDTANLAPAVTAAAATVTTSSSARISAAIDNAGQATTYTVQYGTTGSYGGTSTTAVLAATAAPKTVTLPLSHLTTGASYHYRVTATNATGTTSSPDHTFTTS